MAKILTPLDCLPPEVKRRLALLPPGECKRMMQDLSLANEDLRNLFSSSPEANLAKDLHRKLLDGFLNMILDGERRKPDLDPMGVESFLASLANSETPRLPWEVKLGLEFLGIERPSRRGGRPRDRNADLKYAIYVETAMKILAEHGIWQKK